MSKSLWQRESIAAHYVTGSGFGTSILVKLL